MHPDVAVILDEEAALKLKSITGILKSFSGF
jgi:hypothetical protein